MKLYALAVNVWNAADYINQTNTNPMHCDLYLFDSQEKAEEKAKSVYYDSDIYNDGTIYMKKITEKEIEKISEISFSEFKKMLAEPYSNEPLTRNFGEEEKEKVADSLFEDCEWDWECPVDCANHDFDKSLEGSILVFWSWQKYIGYARKCIEVRYADDETEAFLTKQDRTFVAQCDVLLNAEEVRNAKKQKKLYFAVLDELQKETWKWTNPSFAERQAEQFE